MSSWPGDLLNALTISAVVGLTFTGATGAGRLSVFNVFEDLMIFMRNRLSTGIDSSIRDACGYGPAGMGGPRKALGGIIDFIIRYEAPE
jgi:hypothetical protein